MNMQTQESAAIKSAKEFLRINQSHGKSDITCLYISILLDEIDRITNTKLKDKL